MCPAPSPRTLRLLHCPAERVRGAHCTCLRGHQAPLRVGARGIGARVYRHATVAFIGGSLVPTGGHNPIEPAAVGVPTCFGPHMTNFREIASVFVKNGAAAEVTSARDVAAFARKMIDDAEARRAMGERGRRTVEENRGAAERTARRIVELLA